MELSKIYESTESKYSPLIGYLSIIPLEGIRELLEAINNESGIMYDFFGFEYEDDRTLTFYDFSSEDEKKINISIDEFILFIQPITIEYLIQNPHDTLASTILNEFKSRKL